MHHRLVMCMHWWLESWISQRHQQQSNLVFVQLANLIGLSKMTPIQNTSAFSPSKSCPYHISGGLYLKEPNHARKQNWLCQSTTPVSHTRTLWIIYACRRCQLAQNEPRTNFFLGYLPFQNRGNYNHPKIDQFKVGIVLAVFPFFLFQ